MLKCICIFFTWNLSLFRTDFILKIAITIKEEMKVNGMKKEIFERILLYGRGGYNRAKYR